MAGVNYTRNPDPIYRPNCFRTVGLTLVVTLLLAIPALFWVQRLVMRTPDPRDFEVCKAHMVAIHAALGRYTLRYDKYPATLEDLFPQYIEDRSILHCPRDETQVEMISYGYARPEINAPGSTTILECRRHVLGAGKPPVELSLRKDGSTEATRARPLRSSPR